MKRDFKVNNRQQDGSMQNDVAIRNAEQSQYTVGKEARIEQIDIAGIFGGFGDVLDEPRRYL